MTSGVSTFLMSSLSIHAMSTDLVARLFFSANWTILSCPPFEVKIHTARQQSTLGPACDGSSDSHPSCRGSRHDRYFRPQTLMATTKLTAS